MTKSKIELIAENLLTIYPLLYKSLSKPLRKSTSITPGGMFVLAVLKRNGMLTMSEIGKHLSMPKPHVTAIIDKLIEEQYVERLNDASDRRIVNIKITEKGLSDLEDIKRKISLNLKDRLSSLSDHNQDLLISSTQNVKEQLISISSNEMETVK